MGPRLLYTKNIKNRAPKPVVNSRTADPFLVRKNMLSATKMDPNSEKLEVAFIVKTATRRRFFRNTKKEKKK